MSLNDKNKLTYFIDLDGTMLDKNTGNRITRRNLTALLLVKNFANIVISTGRCYSDPRVKQVMFQLGITDAICSSGAEIYINHEKKIIFPLDKKLVADIHEYCLSNKIIMVIFDKNGESIYTADKFALWISKVFILKKFYKTELLRDFNIDDHDEIIKIAFILKNNKTSKKQLEKYKLCFGSVTNAYLASANYVIEITDAKTNKGIASSLYMKEKKIDIDNTIHIGDSDTDISVKGYVGKLVAMKNGSKELKAVADVIGPKCKRGGLYKYFISKKKENGEGDKND